jgi:hypothetical protein
MHKRGHIVLLLSGLGVSFLAYIQLWARSPTASLNGLLLPLGWLTLLFEFSPFMALAGLVWAARALHWHRTVLQASLITDYTVSLLSIAAYGFLLSQSSGPGERHGHPGPEIALWVIASWSWCALAGLWLLAWLLCSIRNETQQACL